MKRMACWVVGLAVIWSLFVSATAGAVERPFRIVIDGGLAIAKLRDVEFPYSALESMKSFTASVGVSWRLSDGLAVEPRVSYLVKGISFGEVEATDEEGNFLGEAEMLYAVDVLEIPVLLSWTAPVRGSIRPSLALGPFVSFELNERFGEMIVRQEPAEHIRAEARTAGMRFLVDDGVDKIRQGVTTVEEVVRVVGRRQG